MTDSTVTCLNCGRPAGPRFCGHCGQAIDDRRAPLLSLLRELGEQWLSIDGRLVRTLRTLVHPGRLTRLYLDGQRVPFLAPIRLYLLSSVILFSSVLTLQPPDARNVNLYVGGQLLTETPHVRGRPTITIGNQDSAIVRSISTHYRDNFARLRTRPPQEIVDRLFNGLRNLLPIALIAFVPILALALKALYVRRGVLYVDHLIFGVHFQSALFIAIAAAWIVLRVARAPFLVSILSYLAVFLFMATFYLSHALWRVYGEARVTRWAKTALLMAAYLLSLQVVFGPAILLVISQM